MTVPINIHKILNRYLVINISVRYLRDMEIRLKLRKIGSSFMIAIPSQVVEDLNLRLGDSMLLDIRDSKIVIRKENR